MTVIDLVVFGFILLSIFFGFISGFDKQVKKMGSGLKGVVISGALVFIFGAQIISYGPIKGAFDSLSQFFIDKNLNFLSDGIGFSMIRYSILYLIVLIAVKIVFEVISGVIKTDNSENNIVNRMFGAVLAGAISVVFFMLLAVAVTKMPDNADTINKIREGWAKIFLDNNPFLDFIG